MVFPTAVMPMSIDPEGRRGSVRVSSRSSRSSEVGLSLFLDNVENSRTAVQHSARACVDLCPVVCAFGVLPLEVQFLLTPSPCFYLLKATGGCPCPLALSGSCPRLVSPLSSVPDGKTRSRAVFPQSFWVRRMTGYVWTRISGASSLLFFPPTFPPSSLPWVSTLFDA